MNIRTVLTSFFIILAGLAAGYFISKGVNSFLEITFQEKDLSGTMRSGNEKVPSGKERDPAEWQLPLRIVDLGGVGVIPDTAAWGSNYEHNQHFFEDVMTVDAPFIDTSAFEREKVKLGYYAGRMARFGYNAIALPWFLEFVNFDSVGNGRNVYDDESIYRQRHQVLGNRFAELMSMAADSGLRTYLWTDMVALTSPLKDYFEQLFGSLDAENPAFWDVYQKAAEEAFGKFPQVDGMIIRIGEAGSVYNKPGWDYTSELSVRTDRAVQMMLEAFLAAAEKYERTIIFRTWTVGVGKIGDLHTNPETYERVLGEISSDRLVVSTKYCSGDFYSWLQFNPTLYQGSHRRIAEIQAKREFEGFGAIPNYVGRLHQNAIRSFIENNPRFEGVWVWTQYGGPLRAGPMIIYPFYGFNGINDANVYAVSRIMMDPYADLDSISAEWIRGYFGADSLLVANMTDFLNRSHGILQSGLYISEFAKYDVRALGLEPPPMLWIFEWDILGASMAVFSNIYFITRDKFQHVIDEGLMAVQGASDLKQKLLEVRDRVSKNVGEFDKLLASAGYETDLFRLLYHYRQFFMNYYRWIDTGDATARTSYKLAMGQFMAMMKDHQEKYGSDLNTLGMEFSEVSAGIGVAERTAVSVRWARIVVAIAMFLLLMGIPGFVRDRSHRKFAGSLYFDSLFRPYLVSNLTAYHSSGRLMVFLVTLYLLSLVIFSSFASLLFPLSVGVLGLIFAAGLAMIMNRGRNFSQIMVTLMAPKVMIMSMFLFIAAIRGPVFFWYQIWVSDLFRVLFLTILLMLFFRKFHLCIVMGKKWSYRNYRGAAAMVFMMLGFQILLAGVALQLFGLEESLTALNDEMLILPGGLSRIMGITTHLGIPLELPLWMIYAGSGITGCCFVLFLFNRKAQNNKPRFRRV